MKQVPDGSSLRRWFWSAAFLWSGIAIQKLAWFAFQIGLGRRGGFAAVGVAASMGTACSLAASFSSLGLADRAMYRAAAARSSDRTPDASVGTGHGLFLAAGLLGFAALAPAVPAIVEDRGLRPLAGLMLIGALVGHQSAYSIAALRGLGEPARETLAEIACSAILVAAVVAKLGVTALGIASAVAALASLVIVVSAARTRPWLRPRIGAVRELAREAVRAMPYLAVATGCVVLGGVDVLLARVHGGSTQTGVLQCATAVLRAGLYGPWMLGSLLVHRVSRRVRTTNSVPVGGLVLSGLVLAAIAVAGAWITMPWVIRAYSVAPDRVIPSEIVALCVAPPGYVALVLVPVATGFSARRTAACVWIALTAALAIGSVAVQRFGVPGAIVACAAGYLILTLLLVGAVLRRPRMEDLRAL